MFWTLTLIRYIPFCRGTMHIASWKHSCYTEEQNIPLDLLGEREPTWRGPRKDFKSCLKSVVPVWLKLGKSLRGRSFIKPFAADLCCSFSRAKRGPGHSTGALAFQKVPAPLAQHSAEALIRETAEDKCAYKMRVGLYLMLSNLYPSSLSSD